MKRIQIDKREPAQRPVSLELSVAEIIALVEYHKREAKAATRAFGKNAMILATSPLPQSRKMKMLSDDCAARVKAHELRACGVLSLAQEIAMREVKA